jgi:hypothetical protein
MGIRPLLPDESAYMVNEYLGTQYDVIKRVFSILPLLENINDVAANAVTSVTADAPIESTGGQYPVISIPAATAAVPGHATAAQITKLDGIEVGANNYTHPANHPPAIITQDASNRFVTDTEKATWNGKEDGGAVTAHLSAFTHGDIAHTNRTALDAITGVNTGDETVTTIKTKLGITTLSGSNTGDQEIPVTLPASDVYAWAKAAVKPTYTKAEVDLGNVDNTSDVNKPVSTAQQSALDLKAPLASPALTGNPTAPTLAVTDSSTGIATTAHISNAFAGSIAASGYQKFKNGIVIQWGLATCSATPGAAAAVAFPLAFTTIYRVFTTGQTPNTNNAATWMDTGTTTGFNIHEALAGKSATWLAIGYITPA